MIFAFLRDLARARFGKKVSKLPPVEWETTRYRFGVDWFQKSPPDESNKPPKQIGHADVGLVLSVLLMALVVLVVYEIYSTFHKGSRNEIQSDCVVSTTQ